MVLESVINAVFQVFLFSVIPFIWWFFSARKEQSFLTWLGLQKPVIENKGNYFLWFVFIIILLFVPLTTISYFYLDTSTLATNRFTGLGFSALIPALFHSIVQTGLSEELLFRGFLMKRFMHKFGFQMGNIMQSLLFGILHGLLMFSFIPFGVVVLVVIATAFVGYLLGWINERKSNGSILTSWAIHSIVNLIAAFMAMFNIL
ncbi:CPBP family intramembrane glutamic endopeptidase [Lysinibacillus xylanilyticus]|uniref:CPBP family intramembrane metalloprotease n=1 Tax=Lysinibacillus xylanilyticus TaxID=582475 RepID=A0ABT4ESP3_9BACI|nr:CPBP family intramembrane glutamic endopeptidase [Lysinibacillus xylanilyticus]MCY9548682.1 CPBP family intramembrane metalloprotease [Lysinibacillus xylanilyticus]MED3802284.1 CPBP family intramembrane metalloprotease [Lysinibacillus xylanilyticus]